MPEAIIYLDPDSPLSLQAQIRQKFVEAILNGTFVPGRRLPSSRKLADQLGVARNTVVMAYEQLIDEGYLLSQQRSGIYVNGKVLEGRVGYSGPPSRSSRITSDWRQRFKSRIFSPRFFQSPANWEQHPYPFIDGQFDASLYPVAAWREASRLSLGVREINEWSTHNDDDDDWMLIEEIRTKILPRRGIQAEPDEILVTVGAQQSLYLLCQLLVDQTVAVAVEEPCYPDFRYMLAQRGAPLIHQPLDEDGMVVDERLDACQLVYVTPSHQVPTAVTMSMDRRRALLEKAKHYDFLIIEDDFESESNYLGSPHPALRSIDRDNRVIYVSSLSKVLAPGVRLGFMVAAPEIINEARALRRLMVRNPPLNNQRAAAFFLSLGHYDVFMSKLSEVFRERWVALRDALNYKLQQYSVTTHSQGGTTCWVRAPEEVDVRTLITEAARRGILLEPVDHYYAFADRAQNCYRMGVTGIPVEKIREGVDNLASLVRGLASGHKERLENASGDWLTGTALQEALEGYSLLSKTVYGDPFTIDLLADGSMIGRAGYNNEDCDTGRWWVEGDKWFRQWKQWAYGEQGGYFVVIDRKQIKMFNDEHQMIFTAVMHKTGS